VTAVTRILFLVTWHRVGPSKTWYIYTKLHCVTLKERNLGSRYQALFKGHSNVGILCHALHTLYGTSCVYCTVLNPSHVIPTHEKSLQKTVWTMSRDSLMHRTLNSRDIYMLPHGTTHTWSGSYVGLTSVSLNGIPLGFTWAMGNAILLPCNRGSSVLLSKDLHLNFLGIISQICVSTVNTFITAEQKFTLLELPKLCYLSDFCRRNWSCLT
jgi:hypothetical protein